MSELQVFANETAVPSPIVSGSTYQIKQSTLAMDVPGSSTTNGTQLIVYGSNSGANQKFVITATTAGTYTIKNVNSGLCLDLKASSTTAGAQIIQWTCAGTSNQTWSVTPTPTGYALVSAVSGQAITAASASNNALLTQQPNTGTALQSWNFSLG